MRYQCKAVFTFVAADPVTYSTQVECLEPESAAYRTLKAGRKKAPGRLCGVTVQLTPVLAADKG